MKSLTFIIAAAAASMASLVSGRVINKARTAPEPATISAVGAPAMAETPSVSKHRQAFELDVTTSIGGLQDFYSREDGFIVVQIEQGDILQSTVVRSVRDDVVCTIRDPDEFQIRKIGGELSDHYEPETNDPVAASISCFFEEEEPAIH